MNANSSSAASTPQDTKPKTADAGRFWVTTVYEPIPQGLAVKSYRKLFGSEHIKVATLITKTAPPDGTEPETIMAHEVEARFEGLHHGKPAFIVWDGISGKGGRSRTGFSHYARKNHVDVQRLPE